MDMEKAKQVHKLYSLYEELSVIKDALNTAYENCLTTKITILQPSDKMSEKVLKQEVIASINDAINKQLSNIRRKIEIEIL